MTGPHRLVVLFLCSRLDPTGPKQGWNWNPVTVTRCWWKHMDKSIRRLNITATFTDLLPWRTPLLWCQFFHQIMNLLGHQWGPALIQVVRSGSHYSVPLSPRVVGRSRVQNFLPTLQALPRRTGETISFWIPALCCWNRKETNTKLEEEFCLKYFPFIGMGVFRGPLRFTIWEGYCQEAAFISWNLPVYCSAAGRPPVINQTHTMAETKH